MKLMGRRWTRGENCWLIETTVEWVPLKLAQKYYG